MSFSSPPRGLIVDLITPLNDENAVDGRSLGRLLDRLSPHVHALLLGSHNTGEGKNLASAQRLELFEKAIVVVRGRIPILFWITQDTTEKTAEMLIDLTKVLKQRRYSGPVFWVDTPLSYHSNRGLPTHYQDICSTVEQPIILQNDPDLIKALGKPMKRRNIRTAILKEIVKLEGIVGLIFLGTLDRANNYHRACRGRTGFRIYDGDETSFLAHPSTSGVVSLGANLAPIAWNKVTASSLQIKTEERTYPDHIQQIWELGQYLRDLKDTYHRMPVPIVKEVLADQGIIETPACTYPRQDVEASKDRAKELMRRYGDIH